MISKESLKLEYSDSIRDELFARFDKETGELLHFAYYECGGCGFDWALYLEKGKDLGRAELKFGSYGSSDQEVYKNGEAEMQTAYTDGSPNRKMNFKSWAKGWIRKIEKKYLPLQESYTDLILSSREGNLDKVKSLIQEGIDLEETDLRKRTALFHCVTKNQLEVFELLLQNGANSKAVDKSDFNILDYARISKNFNKVKAIIDKFS